MPSAVMIGAIGPLAIHNPIGLSVLIDLRIGLALKRKFESDLGIQFVRRTQTTCLALFSLYSFSCPRNCCNRGNLSSAFKRIACRYRKLVGFLFAADSS